jgi:hypothetical protein
MPYLPPPTTEDVSFPQSLGKDFWFQVQLIEDKWRRFYPLIPYYPIIKETTVNADPSGASLVGTAGGTIFDPIAGEAVDPATLGIGWQQPHLSEIYRASEVDVFAPPVSINARILVGATDTELHHYGFDRMLDLIVVVPASIFDSVGVQAKTGDKFRWGEGNNSSIGEYTVIELSENQRYLNTATMLYVNLNCQSRRKGS